MQDTKRAKREREILEAAFLELLQRGYRGTTMLAVARRVQASKETLYAWYGDKRGLFRALVAHNAAAIESLLKDALAEESDPLSTLETLGALLLELLLGERAVAINRAAAADVANGGRLGQALSQGGRARIFPLICDLFCEARSRDLLRFETPAEITEIYLGLLLGDQQIRRILGVVPAPDAQERRRRATRAVSLMLRLYGPDHATSPDKPDSPN